MNAIATPPALTPEDLLLMPDDGQGFELVRGELRELNRTVLTCYFAGTITFKLMNHTEQHKAGWVFGAGLGYRCFPHDPDCVRRAAASFMSFKTQPIETYDYEDFSTTVPDLVAEVISPNDLAREVEEKLEDWLGAGVQIVWIVNPGTRTIRVHRRDGVAAVFGAADTLTAEDVLPGFSCPVAELFKKPGAA